MKKLMPFFLGILSGMDKDAFVVEVERFASVHPTGIPGLWTLKEEIDVVIAGELKKLTHVSTAECATHGNVPMAKIRGLGWVARERCHLPHPEDVVNTGDIRAAHIVRDMFAAA